MKKNNKSVLIVITSIILSSVLIFSGCSKKNDASVSKKTSENSDAKVKIGIAKIVQHDALDAVEQGIIDEIGRAHV